MMKTVSELADEVQGRVMGDGSRLIRDVASLDRAAEHDITFIDSPRRFRQWQTSAASALLLTEELSAQLPEDGRPRILVSQPHAAFSQLMLLFRPPRARQELGVSPLAYVNPTAQIGSGTNVYPGAYVGEGVVIGSDCDIHPFVVIGDGCQIGNGCRLHPHVVLYPDVRLGDRVVLHAGVVLGADGFGYRFDGERFRHLPHTGATVLEHDVEVGALSTIDRAMVGETVIGEGTKIDNLVMIAHNCRIGRHNVFASQVGLAGSVETGDYTRFAGQVGVADHIKIGHRCSLGAKAGLKDNVPDGQSYHGYPAGPERDQIRVHLITRKLPEMRTQLQELQRRVAQLESMLTQTEAPSSTGSCPAADGGTSSPAAPASSVSAETLAWTAPSDAAA